MAKRQKRTPLTSYMMFQGVKGLVLFGVGATVLIITAWFLWTEGFSGLVFMTVVVAFGAVMVWTVGALIVALPIWAVLHALGFRGWPVAVVGGASVVGLIWSVTGWAEATAAGAVIGAIAGWGLWWMAYKRGEAAQ